MKTVIVKQGQNIFDISLQEYGTIEGVFEIINSNPQLRGLNNFPEGYAFDSFFDYELSGSIIPGTVLTITDSLPIKKYITDVLKYTNVISE